MAAHASSRQLRDALRAETERPSVQVLADLLLTIGANRNSPALGPGSRSVACSAAPISLPLLKVAEPKENCRATPWV